MVDIAAGLSLTERTGRILGIDYGSKRIGVAVSDPLNIIARSVGVIENDGRCVARIGEIVREYNVEVMVVGIPLTLRGEKGEKAIEVEEFIHRVKGEIGVRVVTVDERLTTSAAHRTLRMMGTTRKQRRDKSRIDEMASALILQIFLDQLKK